MTYKALFLLVIFAFAPSLAQAARRPVSHGYICQLRMGRSVRSTVPVRYEIRGKRLYGYEDEYSATPSMYDLRTNTEERLVAVRGRGRTVTITINKQSRRFTQVTRLGKRELDTTTGYCARF